MGYIHVSGETVHCQVCWGIWKCDNLYQAVFLGVKYVNVTTATIRDNYQPIIRTGCNIFGYCTYFSPEFQFVVSGINAGNISLRIRLAVFTFVDSGANKFRSVLVIVDGPEIFTLVGESTHHRSTTAWCVSRMILIPRCINFIVYLLDQLIFLIVYQNVMSISGIEYKQFCFCAVIYVSRSGFIRNCVDLLVFRISYVFY